MKNELIFYGDISEYYQFPKFNTKKESFDWWFFNSEIEEFCEYIYKGIYYRNLEILKNAEKNKAKTIIIDKGIDTFETRIIANFLCRGFKEKEVIDVMNKMKNKIGIEDIEDLKIFISRNNSLLNLNGKQYQ